MGYPAPHDRAFLNDIHPLMEKVLAHSMRSKYLVLTIVVGLHLARGHLCDDVRLDKAKRAVLLPSSFLREQQRRVWHHYSHQHRRSGSLDAHFPYDDLFDLRYGHQLSVDTAELGKVQAGISLFQGDDNIGFPTRDSCTFATYPQG